MKPATGTSRTVIVGGGLAGLELARQLETYGAGDVLVLEAGSRTELRHVNMTESGEDALRLWRTTPALPECADGSAADRSTGTA